MILFWCKFLDFYPSAERTTSLSNWRVLRNVVLFQFHIVRCCKKNLWASCNMEKLENPWEFLVLQPIHVFWDFKFCPKYMIKPKKGNIYKLCHPNKNNVLSPPPLSHNYALESRTEITLWNNPLLVWRHLWMSFGFLCPVSNLFKPWINRKQGKQCWD